MAEEIKEEKKATFKEKVKRIVPWVLGGIGTVGAAVLGYKYGKFNRDFQEEMKNENAINRYLLDRVDDLKSGEHVGVGIIDQDNNETYAELVLCDSKPEWYDNSYEVTTESYFANLVTSTSTKK